MELESSFSNKLDVSNMDRPLVLSLYVLQTSLRMRGYEDIRQALHKTFMIPEDAWMQIPKAPLNINSRNEVVAMTARDIEFSSFSFSSSPEGYQRKIITQVNAVRMLAQPKPWNKEHEAFEAAQDVLRSLEQLCIENLKKTGRKH